MRYRVRPKFEFYRKSLLKSLISGRGWRRSRDEKGNQGVGDFPVINILQLFYIYSFVAITLLYHFFYTFFYPRHLPTPTPTSPRPTTYTHYPRPTTFSYTPLPAALKKFGSSEIQIVPDWIIHWTSQNKPIKNKDKKMDIKWRKQQILKLSFYDWCISILPSKKCQTR